jgi:uncharacterized membrane protein YdjX (TVP38/TMEM64 family)
MTWTQIGTLYGILGAIFYISIVYFWAFLNSSQAGLPAQWDGPMRYVTFFGLLLFAPVVTFPSIVLSLFGPAVTTDVRNVVMIISMPLMGAVLGSVFGYWVGWLEKSGVKRMILPMKTR